MGGELEGRGTGREGSWKRDLVRTRAGREDKWGEWKGKGARKQGNRRKAVEEGI